MTITATDVELARHRLMTEFIGEHVKEVERGHVKCVIVMDDAGKVEDVYPVAPFFVMTTNYKPLWRQGIPEDVKHTLYRTGAVGWNSMTLFDLATVIEVDDNGVMMNVYPTIHGYALVVDAQLYDPDEITMISYYLCHRSITGRLYNELVRLAEEIK